MSGDVAAGRWGPVEGSLPGRLEELSGPSGGVVELPLHVAWSGLRVFDLDDERLLLGAYRVLLNNGLREDLVRLVHPGLLVGSWPRLRKMLGRDVRTTWERAFPELRRAAA